eukprot:CAMPEP_0203762518 /NCGR_PEP_ID=MMETSP0098-20131031/15389_1 /ASSEMBLY_ACC=CAM_ASM_000208 /TAXON_ID=96639 /ORGANISM=" , Strain NY0313808BC1" /LENGTH=40 /DNA_ID= /DNA_START= /DNA_END= /DNA_ORIENTATION=
MASTTNSHGVSPHPEEDLDAVFLFPIEEEDEALMKWSACK